MMHHSESESALSVSQTYLSVFATCKQVLH